MATSLEGRVVAIAGAGGLLGPAVVQRLAPAGARLSLAGRDKAALDALATDAGSGVDAVSVDLLDAEATRAWARGIVERHGRVDALVHLVGGWWPSAPIEEASLEDWGRFHDLLITTYQHTTQAFVPHLLASGRGRVMIVSTSQAQAPNHKNASYAAAKAAAEAWTLALADRFRGTGSTANIIVVASIVTASMRTESPDKDFSTFTPAEEIAEAVAYLCSDTTSSMNGQRLTLRGAA